MKTMVILNPNSRIKKSKKIEYILRDKLTDLINEFMITSYPGHATAIANKAVREKYDTIVVVGGDGTINEVLNGIVGSEVAMGIIPTGSANDLATYYHLPINNFEKACNIIVRHHVHRADLIRINNIFYITAGGVGFPSDVDNIAFSIKNRSITGKLISQLISNKLYLIASLVALFKAEYQHYIKVRSNEIMLTSAALSLTICNQPFLGKYFFISPGAVNDDGLCDVCLIENVKNRISILSIILKVLKGNHIYSPFVKMWRTNELIIEADSPKHFLCDGELLPESKVFNIQVIPHALNVIVPETWSNNLKERKMRFIRINLLKG